MIASTRWGLPCAGALSIACSRIRYMVISASYGIGRSRQNAGQHGASLGPCLQQLADRSGQARTFAQGQEAGDDLAELL